MSSDDNTLTYSNLTQRDQAIMVINNDQDQNQAPVNQIQGAELAPNQQYNGNVHVRTYLLLEYFFN